MVLVAGEPSGHDEDGGPVDHGLMVLRAALIVAGEAAVAHQPAEGPLDDPAPFQDLERVRAGPGHDFEGDAGRLAHPVAQRGATVGANGQNGIRLAVDGNGNLTTAMPIRMTGGAG